MTFRNAKAIHSTTEFQQTLSSYIRQQAVKQFNFSYNINQQNVHFLIFESL